MQKYQVGLHYLASYPEAQLYRLIVEGRLLKKEQGYQCYEDREPGSLAAFFKALGFAIQNLQRKELSLSFINGLHRYCSKVENITPKNIPGQIRTQFFRVWFGLSRKTTTKEGIIDLLRFIQDQKLEGAPTTGDCIMQGTLKTSYRILFSLNQDTDEEKLLETADYIAEQIDEDNNVHFLASEGATVLQNKLTTTIENYNQCIRKAKTPDEILKTIVDTVYDLYHHHPYPDVNLRTIVLLLMDFLLMQNGLPPATLERPFNFNGNSREQVLQHVKKGIEDSLTLIEGTTLLHGFDANLIRDQDDQFAKLVASFRDTLQRELGFIRKRPISYLFNPANEMNKENEDHRPIALCKK